MLYRLNEQALVTSADYMLDGDHTAMLIEGLEAVNKQSGMELDTDAVGKDVLSGRLRNLTVVDNEFKPIGFVLYHVAKTGYDINIGLHVIAMYMRPGHTVVTTLLLNFIKLVARSLGAKKVVGISRRKGWSRRMKPDVTLQLGIWDLSNE